jgi:transcription antitermination factor NusG
VQVPLINSYVFVNIEEKHREQVFEVAGVVRYLFWLGKPAVVKEAEIEALRESLKYTMSAVEVRGLQVGDSMQIPSGRFQGKDGLVKQIKKNSLQLVLTELGVLITLTKSESI